MRKKQTYHDSDSLTEEEDTPPHYAPPPPPSQPAGESHPSEPMETEQHSSNQPITAGEEDMEVQGEDSDLGGAHRETGQPIVLSEDTERVALPVMLPSTKFNSCFSDLSCWVHCSLCKRHFLLDFLSYVYRSPG